MGKYPALLYLSIFLSAVGGFLFGYDTGVIAGAMPLIERDVPFWGEKNSGERLNTGSLNSTQRYPLVPICCKRVSLLSRVTSTETMTMYVCSIYMIYQVTTQ